VKIAVIGTGNVGTALGGSFVKAGHDVTLAGRDAEKTKKVATELGASAAESAAEATSGADVIVLAIPYGETDALAQDIGTEAAGKVIVDVTNPVTPDYSGLATAGGPSGAERVAQLFRGARVAKAFNTVFATLQANPKAHGTPLDALIATDDDEARRKVAELASSIGFRPIDLGSLAAASEMEALAWLNIRLQMQKNGDWRSSFVLVGAPEAAVAADERELAQLRR
jgi:NADPH-dependent F420 reductase